MFYAVFAADTGKFWLGTLSSQSSNLTFLLSVAFFLGYCRRPSPWAALALLLAMAYTLNIHERYYSLIPFVPLLAWPALRKHPLRLLSLWFLVPLLQGLYMVYALLTAQADAYQVSVLAQDETLLVTLTTAASLSVVMLALTLLPPLPAALLPLPLALGSLAGILSAGAVWGWVRKGYAPLRGVLPYLLGGLAIIVLGYIPFSITAEYRDLSTRTLFLSIIGGALVYGVALWFLLRPLPRSTVLLALAVGLVVLLNTERNLVVHSQYRAAAIQNQQQIQQFLDAVGELPPEHLLWVVVDESVNLGNLRYDWFIQAQLTYLYEHPIFVCLMVTGESDLISDSPHCELTANAVHLAPYRERTAAVTVPYSELVIVRVTPDASTRTGYAVALESVLPVAALPFPDSAAAAYQPATVTQPFDAGTRRYRAFADGL